MSDDRDLAQLLLVDAVLLERRGLDASATLARRAARRIAECGGVAESAAGSCRGCGATLEPEVGAGRPRIWCRACRPRDRRRSSAKSEPNSRVRT